MERLAAQSRTKDPLCFFTASWSLGEKPTIEQANEAADTYTRKLRFEGLQVVWSLQNDAKAGLYHQHGASSTIHHRKLIAGATSDNTRRAYETGWRQFAAHALSLEPLGAHPALVATFLGSLRDGGASAQTLSSRAAAILFFHRTTGLASRAAARRCVRGVQCSAWKNAYTAMRTATIA
jgi:hypothetical protein